MPAGRLAGRVALITGGGVGLGEGIARRFAAEGARVAVCGRRREPLERVAGDLGGLAIVADVGAEADVARAVGATVGAFGRLDILVNNAGGAGQIAPVEDLDAEAWDDLFAGTVRGTLLGIKHAAPHLKRAQGAILNMASRLALTGYPRRSPYAAAKQAVIGITLSVAHELGPAGVRVNCLAPGSVDGPRFRGSMAKRAAQEGHDLGELIDTDYVRTAALRALVPPVAVDEAALYLVSDEARAVTGLVLKVDAGRVR